VQAHVLITDKNTHKIVTEHGFWGTKFDFSPTSYPNFISICLQNPRKKYFGMIADILGTRPNDLVFLYERQVGFHGIYKVVGIPFFDTTPFSVINGNYPIRIEIECLSYFSKPVPEDYLFSTKEYETKFWGWFYRKIQGGRGISTVNPEATKALIELLVKINGNAVDVPHSFKRYNSKAQKAPIIIPLTNKTADLEDLLRAWIVQNLGDPTKADLIKIFGPIADLEWFANNVPYHVTQKNIDILVYHKNMRYTGFPLRYQFSVVELKRGRTRPEDVTQLVNYSKWVAGRLANSEIETVQPILIAYDFDNATKEKAKNSDFSDRGISLFRYWIENGDLHFGRVNP
jgi:hypothetical protein